jgi:hypothetical protein
VYARIFTARDMVVARLFPAGVVQPKLFPKFYTLAKTLMYSYIFY